MCRFVPWPTARMSKSEKQELWNKLLSEGKIFLDESKTLLEREFIEVDDEVLTQYIWCGQHFHSIIAPSKDPTFEAKCAEYKKAWNEFKPRMLNTSKTFTIK
jgi:hypothetical protein